MSLAPIALFVYNRPEHTRQTLRSLSKNHFIAESELYIFCDGAKVNDSPENMLKIQEVRALVQTVNWCKKVHVVTQEENKGLAASIVNGVTRLTGEFGKVIVLEDDLVTAPGFLKFMNEALDLYQNESFLMHISGYMYPQLRVPFRNALPETFAMRVMACWGWATWKRAWDFYQDSAEDLLKQLQSEGSLDRFNLDGITKSFEHQLVLNIEKKINTWAIKWYASIFLKNGLCLFPKNSLVINIGNDGSGIHSGTVNIYENQKITTGIVVTKTTMEESHMAMQRTKWFYQFLEKRKSIFDKVVEKLKLVN